eukprot:9231784-Pyramimonas_sp.AAC.1
MFEESTERITEGRAAMKADVDAASFTRGKVSEITNNDPDVVLDIKGRDIAKMECTVQLVKQMMPTAFGIMAGNVSSA